jgi:hypothetical protein
LRKRKSKRTSRRSPIVSIRTKESTERREERGIRSTTITQEEEKEKGTSQSIKKKNQMYTKKETRTKTVLNLLPLKPKISEKMRFGSWKMMDSLWWEKQSLNKLVTTTNMAKNTETTNKNDVK